MLPVPDAAAGGAEAVQALGAGSPNEPYALDGAAVGSLSERMGGWVIAACNDKRLAFALAFPFVRKPLSLEAVNSTALQNAGVGLLVIIPGADMPVMTLNQAKMLLMIAAAYGEELNMERVKEPVSYTHLFPCGRARRRSRTWLWAASRCSRRLRRSSRRSCARNRVEPAYRWRLISNREARCFCAEFCSSHFS